MPRNVMSAAPPHRFALHRRRRNVMAGLPTPAAGYDLCTMAPVERPADVPVNSARLREALRSAASALKESGPRFALAGSYALWAYGAPEPTHDVDLVVAESYVPNAVATSGEAGFAIEHPPEDWLFKARTGETIVDVLNGWTGTVSAPRQPRTTTRSRSWCWPAGSASPADGTSQ
jgi:hypothetical protein